MRDTRDAVVGLVQLAPEPVEQRSDVSERLRAAGAKIGEQDLIEVGIAQKFGNGVAAGLIHFTKAVVAAEHTRDEMYHQKIALLDQFDEVGTALRDQPLGEIKCHSWKLCSQGTRFEFAFAAPVMEAQPVQLGGERILVRDADSGQRKDRLPGEIERGRGHEIAAMTAFIEEVPAHSTPHEYIRIFIGAIQCCANESAKVESAQPSVRRQAQQIMLTENGGFVGEAKVPLPEST